MFCAGYTGRAILYIINESQKETTMIRIMVLSLMATVMLLRGVYAMGDQHAPVTCVRTTSPVNMTGDLADPIWDKADSRSLLRVDDASAPQQATQFKMVYDDTYLYIRFESEDTYVWGTKTDRDADIYNEECVELFVSPGNSLHQYYEINVSPLNVVFDACILNPRLTPGSKRGFTGLHSFTVQGLKTAIHVDGELNKVNGAKRWVAVMAIPFTQLIGAANVPPKRTDTWLFNAFRIDAPKDQPIEYQALQPTGKIDFHRPIYFRTLQFQ